jgi:hypothetical protein
MNWDSREPQFELFFGVDEAADQILRALGLFYFVGTTLVRACRLDGNVCVVVEVGGKDIEKFVERLIISYAWTL